MDEIVYSVEDAPAEAARRAAIVLQRCISEKGYARLGVAGGSAASAIGQLRNQLAPALWQAIRLTWVDERCVDFDHKYSNRGTAYRANWLSADSPPGYLLPLWLDGETPKIAKARVETALIEHFGGALDVVLLGMGPDGHIASLFPGHPLLEMRDNILVATLDDSPKPPAKRITLSMSVLKACPCCILLAQGSSKFSALDKRLAGDTELPVNHIPNLTIITDLSIGSPKP